jgi:hypothetical protein
MFGVIVGAVVGIVVGVIVAAVVGVIVGAGGCPEHPDSIPLTINTSITRKRLVFITLLRYNGRTRRLLKSESQNFTTQFSKTNA